MLEGYQKAIYLSDLRVDCCNTQCMSITTSLYIPIDKTSTLTPSEEKGDSVQDTELKAKTLTMADIQKIS